MAPRLLVRSTWNTPRQTPPPNPFDAPPPTTVPRLQTPAAPTTVNAFDSPGVSVAPAGDHKAPPKAPKRRRDNPILRLQTQVAKIRGAMPRMDEAERKRAERLLADVSQGLDDPMAQAQARLRATELGAIEGAPTDEQLYPLPPGVDRPEPVTGLTNPVNLAGAALRAINKPYQGSMSAYGELLRQRNRGFDDFSVGEIGRAAREGFNLQRDDSLSSIVAEDAARGHINAQAWNAVNRRVPGASIVTDLLGGVLADPLSYVTFGASAEVRRALGVVEKATDAATARNVALRGLDVLTPMQRANVESLLAPRAMEALEVGARGGVGVRAPFGRATGHTIVPVRPATEAARTAYRAAEEVPVLGAVPRAGRAAGEALSDVFRPRGPILQNPSLGREVAENLYQAQARRRGFAHSGESRLVRRLTHAMAKADVTPEEMRTIIGPSLDVGGTGQVADLVSDPAIVARLQPVADRYRAVIDDLTHEQVLRGRLVDDAQLPQLRANIVQAGQDEADRILQRAEDAAYLAERDGVDPARIQANLDAAQDHADRVVLRAQRKAATVNAKENYVPRVRTEEGDKLYNDEVARLAGQHDVGTGDPFLQARELERGMSIRQINEALSAELGRPIQYFHEDPLIAMAQRGKAAYGSMAAEDWIGDLYALRNTDGSPLIIPLEDLAPAPHGGPVSRALAAGHVDMPEGYRTIEIKDPLTRQVTNVAVPVEVADVVERTSKFLEMFNENRLGKMWNSYLQWWKTMATVPLPFGWGFHMRNAQSNFFLNWISGMGITPNDYLRARSLQKAMNRGLKDAGDWQLYLNPADRFLMQQAFEREIMSTGVLGALDDLPDHPNLLAGYSFASKTGQEKAQAIGRKANILSTKGLPADAGRRFGQAVEENARLAHFLAAERNLGDIDAAAQSVRRWLFDYHDVTSSEQLLKKFIPFYTWARKATSAVGESILRDPRYLANYARLRNELTEAGDVDLSSTLVPEYIRESPSAIPIGNVGRGWVGHSPLAWGQPAGAPIFTAPDMPFNTPAMLADDAYSLLNAVPGLGRVLPDVGNKSFTEIGRDVAGMVGGPLGVGKALLENVSGVNTFSGAPIRDEYVPSPTPLQFIPGLDTMTAKTRNFVNAVWPTGTKIEGLAPNDPRNQDKQVRRIATSLLGLPFYVVGPTTEESEAYRRLEPVARFIASLQAQGVLG